MTDPSRRGGCEKPHYEGELEDLRSGRFLSVHRADVNVIRKGGREGERRFLKPLFPARERAVPNKRDKIAADTRRTATLVLSVA
ncbi:hypothetical protein PUN28_010735 [Cardiocondyla obscurior]|uniref:Uncharacterized protein n=1 Tax=Cardiocondyla obscurior TaxID=286306 RepID=A0AAW2FJJ3_9HYME